jgi:hypothetical protein
MDRRIFLLTSPISVFSISQPLKRNEECKRVRGTICWNLLVFLQRGLELFWKYLVYTLDKNLLMGVPGFPVSPCLMACLRFPLSTLQPEAGTLPHPPHDSEQAAAVIC